MLIGLFHYHKLIDPHPQVYLAPDLRTRGWPVCRRIEQLS